MRLRYGGAVRTTQRMPDLPSQFIAAALSEYIPRKGHLALAKPLEQLARTCMHAAPTPLHAGQARRMSRATRPSGEAHTDPQGTTHVTAAMTPLVQDFASVPEDR